VQKNKIKIGRYFMRIKFNVRRVLFISVVLFGVFKSLIASSYDGAFNRVSMADGHAPILEAGKDQYVPQRGWSGHPGAVWHDDFIFGDPLNMDSMGELRSRARGNVNRDDTKSIVTMRDDGNAGSPRATATGKYPLNKGGTSMP
jgi:hypothetical protein